MKFPRLRTADSPADEVDDAVDEEIPVRPGFTPAKGKPTPKRRDAESRRRGPVAPPPKTQREAARRTRLTREQRKSAQAERRAGMANGDERHMLPRDKGPVKAFVRDVVDSRRHLIGLFMPLALLVLVAMVAPVPQIQAYAAPGTLVILVVMIIEGVLLGRTVTKRVRQKFPKATESTMSLGWYSFVRASQVRKLRMPKPRVRPGDEVA